MTIYWTSDDCDRQAILTLHLSVGQVILFPYFDHWSVTSLLANQHIASECQCAREECQSTNKSASDNQKGYSSRSKRVGGKVLEVETKTQKR